MKRVSIQDIADRLGVSKGTVSLVLSGKAKGNRISENMTIKVKQMADEMNYYPNEIARSLSTGITMSIGVIVTDISNEFFGKFTFYIQEQAKKHGYTVITTNSNESLEEFNNAVTTLLNQRVAGIIFVPVAGGYEVVDKIMKRNLPLVQIDRYHPDIKASYVIVNNYKISAEVTELMIKKGNKRIAIICYDINLNALTERRQGCIDALKKNNLFDPALVKDINYENQEKEIKDAIIGLKNNPNKIDAIFFCSRKVFITGLKYMHREGVKIPEEMEVVCFDKIDSFAITNIPINYIEQPIKKMGKKAVDILIKQIKGANDIEQLVFDAEIKHFN